MNRVLEEALAQCLARLDEGVSIEDCLRDKASLAADLRPLLDAAQALRGQGARTPAYTAQAFQKGRARMHSARTRQAEAGGRTSTLLGRLLGRPAAIVAVAVVVAALATLGFTSGLFRFDADTSSADVQGVVSSVDPDVIVLTTADGLMIIRIGENTIVLDADGNVISGGDIVPGKPARVEVEEENGGLAAQRIEVKDDDEQGHGAEVEFSGQIQTVGGSTISVHASFGVAAVHIDSQTEVQGALAVGATVEVHAIVESDGSYLAREIEVKNPEGEDGGGGGEDHRDEGASNDVGDDGDGGNGSENDSGGHDDGDGDISESSGSGDDRHEDDEHAGDHGDDDGDHEREVE